MVTWISGAVGSLRCVYVSSQNYSVWRFGLLFFPPNTYPGMRPGLLGSTMLNIDIGQKGNL